MYSQILSKILKVNHLNDAIRMLNKYLQNYITGMNV